MYFSEFTPFSDVLPRRIYMGYNRGDRIWFFILLFFLLFSFHRRTVWPYSILSEALIAQPVEAVDLKSIQ